MRNLTAEKQITGGYAIVAPSVIDVLVGTFAIAYTVAPEIPPDVLEILARLDQPSKSQN